MWNTNSLVQNLNLGRQVIESISNNNDCYATNASKIYNQNMLYEEIVNFNNLVFDFSIIHVVRYHYLNYVLLFWSLYYSIVCLKLRNFSIQGRQFWKQYSVFFPLDL